MIAKTFVILSVLCAFAAGQEQQIRDCLQQDSITCLQMTIFRKAREFFDQPEISIVSGLSFIKAPTRNSRALVVETAAVEQANSVEGREDAIENYISERALNFFQERSLNLDVISVGRAVSQSIPDDVKESMRAMVGEARKKKKKILKKLAPLLKIVKIKVCAIAIIISLAVGLIAKKALLIGIIALVVAKIALLKAVFAKGLGLGGSLGSIGGAIGGLGGSKGGLGGGGLGGGDGGFGGGSGGTGGGGYSGGGAGGLGETLGSIISGISAGGHGGGGGDGGFGSYGPPGGGHY